MADEELESWEDGYVDPGETAVEVETPESYTPEEYQTALAAAVDAARAEESARLTADFDKRRSDLDRRKNVLLTDLRSKGFDATEEGVLVPANPQKALQTIFGMQPEVPAASGNEDEFDWWGATQAERDAYLDRRSDARYEAREKALEERINKQLGTLSSLQDHVLRPQQMQTVADFTAELGVEGLENNETFQQYFQGYLSQLSPEQRILESGIQTAASAAFGQLGPEGRAEARKAAETKRAEAAKQAERDKQRNALGQYAPSGTRTATQRETPGQQDDVMTSATSLLREARKLAGGFDEEFHRASMAPDLADGRSAVEALQEKRARTVANGRR